MADMEYLTRGGTSPQGKPKVYLCCHPDDLSVYLQPIAAELLEKQNCAVWYARSIQPELSDLEQMQLFVIPVTRRFLTDPNRALEVEYPFAITHHIPVLPLMQESGLETLFNQKCGELQFLDKNIKDPTGIRYEEKLEKFLSAVLIGDQLSETIRKAFDAYMFLSYRKKDRLYARKLMELIHQNDFCRDIAIWYDEFLTPGENFNASIQAALEQSNLFVLAVTPNLVNEINYVMTTEYPMAWQTGKPILPVELVATDRADLKEKYVGIPTPANAYSPAALTHSLREATKGLALRKNDSPKQDYLMGLAYLSGVDVEVDHAKAVQLITAAAKAEYPAAVTKLVNMYSTGLGVTRSYETALGWQEYLIRLRERQYRNDPTPTHVHLLTTALLDLGTQLVTLSRYPQGAKAFRYAAELLEAFPRCQAYPKLQRTLACCYMVLGSLHTSTKEFDTAKTFLEKALPIFERLDSIKNYDAQNDYVQCLISLGDLYTHMGDLKSAQSKYNCARLLGLYTAVMDDRSGSGRLATASVLRQAELLEKQGKLQEAEALLLKNLVSAQREAEETKSIAQRRLLKEMYFGLARLRQKQNALPDAEAYYRKASDILVAWAKEADTIESRNNLAIAYTQLGLIRSRLDRPLEAQQAHEKALALYTRLAGEVESYRHSLAESYFYLGELHRLGKRLLQAEACYRKALEIFTSPAKQADPAQTQQWIAKCYVGIAQQYKQANQPEQAIAYFQKAIALDRLIQAEDARDRTLAARYEELLPLFFSLKDFASVRKYIEAIFAIRVRLAKKYQDVQTREDLARAYSFMYVATKNQAYMDSAIERYTALCRAYPDNTHYRTCLTNCKNRLSQS